MTAHTTPVRAFQPIRNPDYMTRAKLDAQVAARFAAMTEETFARFLKTLPSDQRAMAVRLRMRVLAPGQAH